MAWRSVRPPQKLCALSWLRHCPPASLPLCRSCLRASVSFGGGRERYRVIVPRMCAGSHESTIDRATGENGSPPPSTATPSDRRSAHRSPPLSSALIADSFLLYSYHSSSQDGQNSRPARP